MGGVCKPTRWPKDAPTFAVNVHMLGGSAILLDGLSASSPLSAVVTGAAHALGLPEQALQVVFGTTCFPKQCAEHSLRSLGMQAGCTLTVVARDVPTLVYACEAGENDIDTSRAYLRLEAKGKCLLVSHRTELFTWPDTEQLEVWDALVGDYILSDDDAICSWKRHATKVVRHSWHSPARWRVWEMMDRRASKRWQRVQLHATCGDAHWTRLAAAEEERIASLKDEEFYDLFLRPFDDDLPNPANEGRHVCSILGLLPGFEKQTKVEKHKRLSLSSRRVRSLPSRSRNLLVARHSFQQHPRAR